MNSLILYLLCSYLIGSLPIGELVARLKTGNSLIQPGSRNTRPPGEMFATLGIFTGILVCLIDGLKGFLTVYPLAIYFLGENPYQNWLAVSLAGFLTVFGHCNSLFLGFRGGRGLAPTFGVMITLLPIPALLASLLGFWLAFWGTSSKPGALSAAGAMPILSIAWVMLIRPDELDYLYVVATMAIWTMWEHRDELLSYMGIRSKNFAAAPPPLVPTPNIDNAAEPPETPSDKDVPKLKEQI